LYLKYPYFKRIFIAFRGKTTDKNNIIKISSTLTL